MTIFSPRAFASALLGTVFVGLSGPVRADITLSQTPLFVTTQAKPALIIAADNVSYGVRQGALFDTNGGFAYWSYDEPSPNYNGDGTKYDGDGSFFESNSKLLNYNVYAADNGFGFHDMMPAFYPPEEKTTDDTEENDPKPSDYDARRVSSAIPPLDDYGFARSHEFNRMYFNPSVTYEPWGSSVPGEYWGQIDYLHAPSDPRDTSADAVKYNLTREYENSAFFPYEEYFRFAKDMRIPENTRVKISAADYGTLGCDEIGWITKDWQLIDASSFGNGYYIFDQKLDDACLLGVAYKRAQFYLKTTTDLATLAPDFGYDGPKTLAKGACGPGCDMYRYDITSAWNFIDDAHFTKAINNFANWYSYYRRRDLATVAALTRGLAKNTRLRVGMFGTNTGLKSVDYGVFPPVTTYPNLTMYDLSVQNDRDTLFDRISSTVKYSSNNYYEEGIAADHQVGIDVDYNSDLRSSVKLMGDQFMRTGGTTASPKAPVTNACQVNVGLLVTVGLADDNSSSSVGNADGADGTPYADTYSDTLADTAMKYYKTNLNSTEFTAGLVPVNYECLSGEADASEDCNSNLHMNFYAATLARKGLIYGVSTTDAYAYADELVWANPESCSGGLSDPYPPNGCQDNGGLTQVDAIWHSTVNGRGGFVASSSAYDFNQLIDNAINKGTAYAELSSGSIAGAGVRTSTDSFAVVPSFIANGSDWTGELKGYGIKTSSAYLNGTPAWEATDYLLSYVPPSDPDDDDDTMWMVEYASSTANSVVSPFIAEAFGLGDEALLNKLGITDQEITDNFPTATGEQVVNYLRGDSSLEQQRSGGIFRNRSERLGDIIGSVPEIALPTDDYGYAMWKDGSGSSEDDVASDYVDYLDPDDASTKANRPPMIFVGANDGWLHAFEGGTKRTSSKHAGNELWRLMPNGVLSDKCESGCTPHTGVGRLALPAYEHRYYVDGQLAVGDAYDKNLRGSSGSWRTMLVGTAGAGGQTVFGLDVGSGSLSSNTKLWEITSADNGYVGNVIGKPVIAPMKVEMTITVDLPLGGTKEIVVNGPRWMAFVPNGVNSIGPDSDAPRADPALLVIDVLRGEVLATITPPDAWLTGDNGLSSIAVVDNLAYVNHTVTSGSDGFADTIYAGDLHGNIWKFENRPENGVADPSVWTVVNGQPIFTAVSGISQPITGGIEVTSGPNGSNLLLFGTGRYIATGDEVPNTSLIQSLYAVVDDGGTSILTPSNLQMQTITSSDGTYRATSSNSVDYFAKHGWYVNLIVSGQSSAGEMFIATPYIQSGVVYFATYEPSTDPCQFGGKNWLYAFGTLSGIGQFTNSSGGAAGGRALESGAPVRDVVAFLKNPDIVGVNASSSDSDVTAASTGNKCDIAINVPGSASISLKRPCGRQSWRQVR